MRLLAFKHLTADTYSRIFLPYSLNCAHSLRPSTGRTITQTSSSIKRISFKEMISSVKPHKLENRQSLTYTMKFTFTIFIALAVVITTTSAGPACSTSSKPNLCCGVVPSTNALGPLFQPLYSTVCMTSGDVGQYIAGCCSAPKDDGSW